MIAKARSHRDTYAFVRGLLRGPGEVVWVESRGLVRDVDGDADADLGARVMEATAALNPRCVEPCYHLAVWYAPGDRPSERAAVWGAFRTLRDPGLGGHQALAIGRVVDGRPAVDVVANRVHPDTGRVWDRWQDYRRVERSLRYQERVLGLQAVASSPASGGPGGADGLGPRL